MSDLGNSIVLGDCWPCTFYHIFNLSKKIEIYGNCLSKILKGFVVIVLNNVYCGVSGKYKKTQRRKKSSAILVNLEVISVIFSYILA